MKSLESACIACFNCLDSQTEHYFKYLFRREKRWEYQSQVLLPALDVDVFALNEMTQPLYKLLTSEKKLSNYSLSPMDETVIMSRIPWQRVYHGHQTVIGLFASGPKQSESFLVIATHLVARESDQQINKRIKEMEGISRVLKEMQSTPLKFCSQYAASEELEGVQTVTRLQSALKDRNVVLLGDLNFHFEAETLLLYQHGFVDTWLEAKGPKDPGFTWDPRTNGIIQTWLPFDNRRMRLDRIAVQDKSHLLRVQDVQIVAKERIGFMLHPSDHYGLSASFSLKGTSPAENQHRLSENPYPEGYTHPSPFRSFKAIVRIRITVAIAMTILVLFFILRCFFF